MDGRPTTAERLRQRVPILAWFPTYDRRGLGRDLSAGVLVAALMIPQALGYAGIAGVPVQVGLYAIPLALLAYAVLGSSPQLIVGPVSTVSVLSGSLVATQAAGDAALAVKLTSALALAAGLTLVLAGLLGLGWIAEFLSKPIVTGFVFGLTVVIIVGELPNVLGVPRGHGDVFRQLIALARELPDVQVDTLVVGLIALAVLFVGGALAPRIPWALLVLLAGVVASTGLDLAARGVVTVGTVPEGLPPLGLPGIPLEMWPGVAFGGAALALVGLAEGLSAARLFAQAGHYRIDSNTELVATGAANLGAGLSGGLGVAGSLSKTAAVSQARGSSQIVGLSTAILTVVVLVAFVGSIAPLPLAVLSAIVINAVWTLMDVAAIKRYKGVRRNDFVGSMVALGGVLVLGTLYGLLMAIVQSMLGLVYRSSRVDADVMGKIDGEKAAWGSVSRHPERTTVPGILVLRLDAPIFWVNAQDVRVSVMRAVSETPDVYAVVLDLESTNQLDISSADMLMSLLRELRRADIELYLVRVFHFVRGVLKKTGFEDELGGERMWHSISAGVRAAKSHPSQTGPASNGDSTPRVVPADPDLDDSEGERIATSVADQGAGESDEEEGEDPGAIGRRDKRSRKDRKDRKGDKVKKSKKGTKNHD